MSDESPTAWSLGYQDGQLNRPLWRKVLKEEILKEYDEGYWAGQQQSRQRLSRIALRRHPPDV